MKKKRVFNKLEITPRILAMKAEGKSTRQIADAIGDISYASVARIIRGKPYPSELNRGKGKGKRRLLSNKRPKPILSQPLELSPPDRSLKVIVMTGNSEEISSMLKGMLR